MNGLLDFLSTDEGRMGLGLLAAAGPRSDGMNTGGRIQLAMQGIDARKQEGLKSKLLEMQMKNYESEIDARKLAGIKDARNQEYIDKFYSKENPSSGGLLGGTSPGAFEPSFDGMGPTMPKPLAPVQDPRGRIGSMTIDQIQEFKDRTGIDHMPAWKLANEGFERKPGTFVEMPGQEPRYIEDPTKGVSFKNGVIGQMKGSENIARLAGQTSLMTELPKAMLAAGGRLNLRDNGDGTKSPINEWNENQGFQDMLRSLGMQIGPSQPSQPPQPAPMARPMLSAPTGAPGGPGMALPENATSPGAYSLANPGVKISLKSTPAEMDTPRVLQEQLAQATQRLSGSRTPEDIGRANSDIGEITSELRRLGVSVPRQMVAQNTPARYGMTNEQVAKTEANKNFTAEGAKAGAARVMTGYDNARTAVDSITSNIEARKSLAGGAFVGTGAETKLAISKGLASFGFDIAPDKATNTDYLQSTLSTGVLNKAKALGTNPTDNDARIIKSIVGSIGTDPNALVKLLDHQDVMSNRAINDHNKNYGDAKTRGFDAGFDLTIKASGASEKTTPKPQGQAFDTKPPAQQFKDKFATGPDGIRYKSDGFIWKAVN